MTTLGGRLRIHNVLTFYHAGLWQRSLRGWFYGLALGEGSRLLGSRRESFFSRCRAGFISLPEQVRRFLAQYKTGGQPSTTTKLHVLLRKKLHLQARPDNSHGRSAKYAGDVDKSGFGGRLSFGLSRCRFFSSSRSHGRLRPALDDRRLRLDNCSRPLCQLRHKLLYGGGWAAASFSRLPHRLPVAFVPLIYRVGRRNLLQALGI
jgi:hypothetical protein